MAPGSVLFVARTVPHRFHDITERLSVLVFFAPAETAQRPLIGTSSNTGWRSASATKSSTGASLSAWKYGRVAVATRHSA